MTRDKARRSNSARRHYRARDSAPATRRNRLAIVKSFFRFCVDERGSEANPADKIKPPKRSSVERQAYSPDVIEQLRMAQPTLREQIAVRLLGRLALRKNELRLFRVSDFDLARGTSIVHGKGGKVVVVPIAFEDLKNDLHLELLTREPDEYLLPEVVEDATLRLIGTASPL